nr:hypothetical protein Iba_chr07dCG10480 [Ipomoea batatas]
MEVWNLPTGHCCRCLTGAMETGRQHGSETAMGDDVTDSRRCSGGRRHGLAESDGGGEARSNCGSRALWTVGVKREE